ncbi:MAG TPA: antitoxin [Thermoflexales bacterium]|nr:antitoxin [Thermoflexales bacterium]HQW36807.1 antitoxin [Thermoflexales bacterium]HQZ21025.1 antitoxin [Thermoflexales bacterium]HRA01595.1 antitoxin [Thermoflexales bacterium]
MRTTLNLDKDVLEAARALAEQRRVPVGEVISDLARRGLSSDSKKPAKIRNGIRLFPVRPNSASATPELVKQLLEETD